MRRTYLIGNGLSLAFNPEYYHLPEITWKVRERLDAMPGPGQKSLLGQIEDIGEVLRPDFVPVERETFEAIAGPIDRLANTFSGFGPLMRVATEDQRASLVELGVLLRAFYTRVVGAVLEVVMQHPPGAGGWDSVNTVADFLVRDAVDQRMLDVFCLNYDALLDSALLEMRDGEYQGQFTLMDEFRGFEARVVRIFGADRELIEIEALPWRWGGYAPEGPLLRLHHLHGAGTWLRIEDEVIKARTLEEIRGAGLFSAWAEGIEGGVAVDSVGPVVLLGDQKGASVGRSPFNQTYEAFAAAVSSADEIVLAGFSFRDQPLARTISAYRQAGSTIIVINPQDGIDRVARDALSLSNDDRLIVIPEALPDGMLALN